MDEATCKETKPMRNTLTLIVTTYRNPIPTWRKQKDQIESHGLQGAEQSSQYNIWYHKFLGDKMDQRGFSRAPGRCNFAVDCGWTQGTKRPDAFFCLHFARGVCAMGKECGWLHRPPTVGDQMRLAKVPFGITLLNTIPQYRFCLVNLAYALYTDPN